MSKMIIAMLSVLLTFPAWIVFGWFLEYIKLSEFVPWPYSSYLYMGSFGLLSASFYTIISRLTLTREESQRTTSGKFSTWTVKLAAGMISVFLAGMTWLGIVFVMDRLKLPFGLVFQLSQFGAAGWILFGILSIVIYSFMVKRKKGK